ncbi:hypothetical protein [Delftia sp. RIT313]|uniref:hypothetical protein n=1 Tax=Delftia sp. RIT313 TaxID=1468410 RepID=UPI001376C48B|nr:hypothetical protein [Delftia sp. RIT313]
MKIPQLHHHPLRHVYTSSAIQFASQILLLFVLIRSTSHAEFADYNYAALIPGIAAVITNSGFDSLMNKELGRTKGNSGFYNMAGNIKPALYILSAIPAWIFFAAGNPFWLFIPIALANVLIEHDDVLFRFHSKYEAFRARALASTIFIAPKILLALTAHVQYLILCMLIEQVSIIVINKVQKRRANLSANAKDWGQVSIRDLIKSFIGGASIFIFFRIDQLILYQISDKQIFAHYSAAARINDMHNSFTSIFARHIIPKVYSEQLNYRSGLMKLWLANTVGITITLFGSICILLIAAPDYLSTLAILVPLLLSSYFLIFGQIRGIYFVKRGRLAADTINALLGIGIMLCFIHLTDFPLDLRFSLSYFIAFAVTGMATTLAYSTGREFLKNIGRMHHGR